MRKGRAMERKPEFDWLEETGFCNRGCGMHGVNHAENDALCRRRQNERFGVADCTLIYFHSTVVARMIAEGRASQQMFLAETPDGYRPLPTRKSGNVVQIGATDADRRRDS